MRPLTAPSAVPPSPTDSLLLQRVKRGDPLSAGLLFGRYSDRLRRLARHHLDGDLRRRVESMDILQEVFIDALPGLRRFEPRFPGALLPWLMTRVRRKIGELRRRAHAAKRDLRAELSLERPRDGSLPPFEFRAPEKTPSQAFLQGERLRHVEAALETLPPEQKEVLLLRLRGEMTFEEIGRRIGRSADAARMACSRGLAKISGLLDDGAEPRL